MLHFKISQRTMRIATLLVFAVSLVLSHAPASALSGADFNAGRIIDDAVFFNPNTMTANDIQVFLNSKVPVCDTNGTQPYGGTTRAAYGASRGYPSPYTCLKDYSQAIPTTVADSYCGGTVAGGTKSSAQIIYDVSQACGVSPKVLIILLQKEQSLVTDDWPWSSQYQSATGYGCPDTAPCDAEYYGFFNQVYQAARQYQRYVKQAHLFNYRSGQNSYVQYNPNAGCGGTNVVIQNQATAGLYNYTPYQPNAAALANLYGTGDSCSAYGNRNFWRMYIDWFGSPNSNTPWAWSYEGQWAFADAGRTQPFTNTPTVAPNGKIYLRVKARNMGISTWDQSFLHLGVSRPMDVPSTFAEAGWVSNTRAARLVEASVSPGQIGTFEFAMQAPATKGTYNQYFNLVAEGRSWLNDLGLYFTVNVNSPSGVSNSTNTTLTSGQSIGHNDYLLSPDSQSALTLQGDGNLVLYSNFAATWSTGSFGAAANRLIMQGDGNLVLYDQNNVARWNSQTGGNAGARLVLQTDGNMVIYSATNVPLWFTGTTHTPDHLSYVNTGFRNSTRMFPGQSIDTADGKYHLIMQRDGNLVLYSPTRALWATGTDGKSAAFVSLQQDGNLVLYDRASRPLWYSGTAGHANLRSVIQQDGNLVLYNNLNIPFWHTGTAGSL
ncbi:MAG: hypothetical protein QG553_335 [Patescibacteria group bacterium]|nr:hypothetical protein [Patescibacteria group bacterium]